MNVLVEVSYMVLWKCYEKIFDDPKSRVTKVNKERWLKERGGPKGSEEKEERDLEASYKECFTRTVRNKLPKRGHFHEARKAVYLHCA